MRKIRGLAIMLPLGASTLLVGACGGASPQSVAQLGPTSTTAANAVAPSPGGSPGNRGSGLLKFSACIRAHGMPNFPNPVVHGSEVSLTLTPGLKQNPRFAAAAAACRYLLPAGKGSDMTITPADQQDYLRAAACMRAHGVPNFPDPVFSGGGGVHFTLPPGLDVKSRQVNAARLICQKLIPHGLPYSGD